MANIKISNLNGIGGIGSKTILDNYLPIENIDDVKTYALPVSPGLSFIAVDYGFTFSYPKTSQEAIAIGNFSEAFGLSSVAIGNTAKVDAIGNNSVAIGRDSFCDSSANALAIGRASNCVGATNSVAIGSYSLAGALNSIAIGKNSETFGIYSISIGEFSKSNAGFSVSIGKDAESTDQFSVSIGAQSSSNAENSVVLGYNAINSNTAFKSIAIGANSQSFGTNSVTLGADSQANNLNSISLGTSAVSNANNAVQIGQGVNTSINTIQYLSTPIANDVGLKLKKYSATLPSTATIGTMAMSSTNIPVYVDQNGTWQPLAGASGSMYGTTIAKKTDVDFNLPVLSNVNIDFNSVSQIVPSGYISNGITISGTSITFSLPGKYMLTGCLDFFCPTQTTAQKAVVKLIGDSAVIVGNNPIYMAGDSNLVSVPNNFTQTVYVTTAGTAWLNMQAIQNNTGTVVVRKDNASIGNGLYLAIDKIN